MARTDGQAVALSQYGSKFGAYACRFLSYQVYNRVNEIIFFFLIFNGGLIDRIPCMPTKELGFI